MLYLLFAVAASSAVAIIMRLGEKHIGNSFAMFTANYFTCAVIAFLFIRDKSVFVPRAGLPFALILGAVSGCLYLTCFVLMKYNIGKNGVMLTSVFMKLGVLVPAIMAVAVFGERPSVFQVTGFLLAAAAIIIINSDSKDGKKGTGRTAVFLLILLIVSGFTESMVNIYDKAGTRELKDLFLFINFFTAMCAAGAMTLIKRKPVSVKDVLFGAAIGVPNYFTSRFLMLSLGSVPAVVAYPIYNIGAILLICAAGALFFRERLSVKKYIGFGMIAGALVLLNL